MAVEATATAAAGANKDLEAAATKVVGTMGVAVIKVA